MRVSLIKWGIIHSSLCLFFLVGCSPDSDPGDSSWAELTCDSVCIEEPPGRVGPGGRQIELPLKNPWLAEGPYPISHHNPGQTDLSTERGPTRGKDLEAQDAKTVPVAWCSAPIVKEVDGETTVIAGAANGLVKIRATGEAFEWVSTLAYPEVSDFSDVTPEKIADVMEGIDESRRSGSDWGLLFRSLWMFVPLEMWGLPNGAYGVIDRDGYHYTSYGWTRLLKSFDDNEIAEPLRAIKHVDVRDELPSEAQGYIGRIMGLTMTYDGFIVAASSGGLLVFDRELNLRDYLLFPDEHVENSIAADEKRIYVVTSKHMYGVAWDGERLSLEEDKGGWKSPYDVMPEGEAVSRGAASHGSGTSPTLMGFGDDEDHLVLIADGSREGSQLVAFWRDGIPDDFEQKPGTGSRRIADEIRIKDSPLTVEASPTVWGYGVIVLDSTYPDTPSVPGVLHILPNAFLSGVTREPPRGMQKFDWDPEGDRFVESWYLAYPDNTDWMPPAVSPHTGLAYLAHKEGGRYEYQAVDWDSGNLVARWRFPDDGVIWNTWGGITTLLQDGDLLLGGFFAVKRFNVGHLD
ncbi:MAG: hypothetical protein ACJZ7Z_05735 [Myxococcota bacterium]